MKIRSDFVSNSSSSSFVFSTKLNNYALSDHINNILKSKGGKISTDDHYHNETVIRYCCQFYKLMFLGYIDYKVGDEVYSYGNIIGDFNLDDILQKGWFEQSSDEEWLNDIYDSISKYCKANDGFYLSQEDHRIAKITKETIEITEKLIKLGKDVHLKQSKINAIKKALDDGDDVYIATFRDDGEGRDSGSIFVPRSSNISIENISKLEFENTFHLPVLINVEHDYKE